MPVQTLSVRFICVSVEDDSDVWGAGEWHMHAMVNGQRCGNTQTEFVAREGALIMLPAEDWTEVVDVSGHSAGDEVAISFRVIEDDVFSDDDLGEVTATLRFPYTEPYDLLFLESPLLSGGLFADDYRAYNLVISVRHNTEVASTNVTGATRIPVTRSSQGGATFNTVRGEAFIPRVDIHGVIPVPQPPSHVPRPVHIPSGLAAAVNTPAGRVTTAPSAPALNSLANPSVIPVLSASDPDFANRVANLAITAYEPGNLDTSKLFWKVASGPAVIVGGNTGLSIQARGESGSSADDSMAVFEVRWESITGPLLSTYRAWVGKLGTLKYRVNLLDGRVPPGAPSGTAAPFQTSTLMTPAQANSIMQVVRAILYQTGILLVPDPDTTGFEGATITGTGNAVFQLTVSNNQHTNNVDHNIISSATRYNFKPGVINFAIVYSTSQGNAAAVERNGIEGSPDTGKRLADNYRYTYNGSGVEKTLGGSPSSSWIKPAGVGRDGDGITQTMRTINPTDRANQARKLDRAFVTARKAVDPAFTAAKMGELYACQVPARWANSVSHYTWRCGINFAHELGHVLGLAHRGSGGNSPLTTAAPSADGMNFTDTSGATRGHPWYENIMCYGYLALTPPRTHDMDLLQSSVVRRHPAINYA